ncbi:outer membrane protein assembly factor BamB [Rhodobacter aestuarii]|uniref:Outer membrane protein assembly factor BamB, contains PQQ-like beta-propeller repeat n=2 Tax=Rhodobacter aestuarii TaxID=453582 RepID=A0A1N7J1D1_9RHOB|nr:outer membrane protein assembly factor BamB [Rhodobacter aestuarii]SIS43175.1 Outer membrane protein assembly factor BamB, contains PQQ-like beta-propeller repeat [Rhodobacter aestuarii]
MKRIAGIAILGAAMALTACEREVHLEGERLDPRAVLGDGGGAEPASALEAARPISLPAVVANADWPQRGGSASHGLMNAAIGQGLTHVWSAPIGQGQSRRYRIAAAPVAAGGKVFTLDSRAQLTATATSGATVWATDIAAPGDRDDDATGSGLAYADGRIYATTGFAELVAVDAASGAVVWRQKFDAGIGGAPTVADGSVYVLARDGSAWAIDAADGKVQWQMGGVPGKAGMSGVSAPAIAGKTVIFPFATGEMVAVERASGMGVWRARVVGGRTGRGYTIVSDLTGDPVVVGNTVYAGSSAGKLGAFDATSGMRLWGADEGAVSPVQVAGGSIFLISDEGKLMRLDASTGETIWSEDLPYFVKDKIKRQNEIHVNLGPVLAGGKLFVVSSDGLLRSFDPANGALIGQAEIPGGAATDAIVAGSTLYVVSRTGQLHAFR